MEDKELCVIEYNNWGRQINDRYWYIKLPDGTALDYGSLKHCKDVCKKEGLGYIVVRHHRNHTMSVLEHFTPLSQS